MELRRASLKRMIHDVTPIQQPIQLQRPKIKEEKKVIVTKNKHNSQFEEFKKIEELKEKKIIDTIRVEKCPQKEGYYFHFTINVDAFDTPCYTITYLSEREKLLAILTKENNQSFLSRFLPSNEIQGKTIQFFIHDIYKQNGFTPIQKLKIHLDETKKNKEIYISKS